MKCSLPYCEKDAIARGYCVNHYYAFRKHGHPEAIKLKQYHGLTLAERFERYVVKREGCWDWESAKDPNGYGRLNVKGYPELAHRISYKIHFGTIPKGMAVCHKCDNPSCTNPDHLFLGTQADNVADMHKKDRARKRGMKGTDHHSVKLTDDAVRAIRASDASDSQLAKEHNVSRATIHSIRSYRSWKHLT
jgi:predicted DNA-binding protein (UPF0251 family)